MQSDSLIIGGQAAANQRSTVNNVQGKQESQPSLNELVEQVNQFCDAIDSNSARELSCLLQSPFLRSLLQAHEKLSTGEVTLTRMSGVKETFEMNVLNELNNDYEQRYQRQQYIGGGGGQHPINDDQDDDSSNASAIRIVGIRKSEDEPLGVTVRVENGQIVIARILAGGLADRQGLLAVGDVILEVNGHEVCTPEGMMEQVRKSSGGITFKVSPSFAETHPANPCYMRALYAYEPSEDTLLPCRELGLSFMQGDILEILNQEDPNWWQARRLGIDTVETNTGLIPSAELEERRRAFVRPEFDYATKTSICGTRVTKKKKKEMYQIQANNEFDKAELNLYEEVCRMPPFERKTLVLLGAQGVGRRTLKTRLINYDPDRFAAALPHTSRPIREGEEDGRVYHFIKREIMEAEIADNEYLECGEHQGHLYGTKLDSIRAIIRSGKMCVIDCNPQCLKLLKTAEFMPYIVFVATPPLEQLRFMHEWGRNHGFGSRTYTLDRAMGRSSRRARTIQSLASFYEDEDLQATIEESARLQRTYEKYFDQIIVNNNFEKSFEHLRESVDALSTEPQWVPISWVYSE